MHIFKAGEIGSNNLEKGKTAEDDKNKVENKVKEEGLLLKPLTLLGHTDCVNSVSMSEDGSRVLSGSSDKTLRFWDLKKGVCLKTLSKPTRLVNSVAMSADGRRGLSGSLDAILWVWDLEKGDGIQKLFGHPGYVRSVAMSADGRRGLSGSSDKTLIVWDLDSGVCLTTLSGHISCVNSVAINANGNLGLSGSGDKTVRFWGLNEVSGVCHNTLLGHTETVSSVAMSADGSLGLSGSGDKTVRFWDLKKGICLKTFTGHTGYVNCVAMSVDRCLGLSGSDDQTLRVWDLKTGECLQILDYQTPVFSIVTHLQNNRLNVITGLRNGSVDFRYICALPDMKPNETARAQEQQTKQDAVIEKLNLKISPMELEHKYKEEMHQQQLLHQKELEGLKTKIAELEAKLKEIPKLKADVLGVSCAPVMLSSEGKESIRQTQPDQIASTNANGVATSMSQTPPCDNQANQPTNPSGYCVIA